MFRFRDGLVLTELLGGRDPRRRRRRDRRALPGGARLMPERACRPSPSPWRGLRGARRGPSATLRACRSTAARCATAPGLRFARLMGCARGRSFGWRPDLRRWALLAVWDDATALERFERESPVARRLRRRRRRSRGRRGCEPLGCARRLGRGRAVRGGRRPEARDGDGRRRCSSSRARPCARAACCAFRRAVPAGRRGARRAARACWRRSASARRPSCGRAPLSLWRTLEDARAFAYASPPTSTRSAAGATSAGTARSCSPASRCSTTAARGAAVIRYDISRSS